MSILKKCDKCGKNSLFTRQWTFYMPYQKITMKSQSHYCIKCAYRLKKGFDIMRKNKV